MMQTRLSTPAMRTMIGWVFLALVATRCAHALTVDLELSQYAHSSWTTRDTTLKGGVRTISQTPDGYLWLGTEFGLLRFDGVRFVEWTSPAGQSLPSTNIRSLLATRDGALWIGTLQGLVRWKDGKLTPFPELAGRNILSLIEDHDGVVWAGSFSVPTGRLCAIEAGVARCYGDDGSLGQWVWSLYEGHDGALWVGAETGLWQWKPGPPQRYSTAQSIETSQAIAEPDEHAGPVAITEGLWQLSRGKMQEYPIATVPGVHTTPVNMFTDSEGGLWIGTLERGLIRISNGKTTFFQQSDGLSSDRVMGFFEDREHNVWVATSDGLDRFHKPTVVSISMKQGLSSPTVWSALVSRDNSVWMTTLDGVNRWKDGRASIYRSAGKSTSSSPKHSTAIAGARIDVTEVTQPGLPDDRVGSLFEDDRGRIWVSSPGGIARFENETFATIHELQPGWVNAITGDNSGGIWISYQDYGLWHWKDGKVVEKHPWPEIGGDVIGSSLLPDPQRGGIWVGFFKGGLIYFEGGRIREHFGPAEGLGAGRVTGLQLDTDGTIWAATESGFSRIHDGKVATLTRANGLPCDTIHWSAAIETSFWVYTACGLLRIPRSEIENWAADPSRAVQFTRFDSSDGVRSRALLTGYTPHFSVSREGKLWFSGLDRLSLLDTHDLRLNPLPPPVKIEQITADRKTYVGADLRLPARVRDVTIDYTALSFVAPEKVRFRYKLEGQDEDWREVINDREVQYSNLRPGEYTFHVMATNNIGVWNEQGDTLRFSVAPAYYQTAWFRVLCMILLIAALWIVYQLRVRRIQHQFDLTLEARANERTRIARELHDTLLQSFHGVLLHLESVSQLLRDRPAEAKERLEKIIERAALAITEGRDAVQGLRDSVVQGNDLALAIRTLGDELATRETSPPALQVTVEGTTRILHPIVRDEIYKLAAEALRNAFRHAEAHKVEADIRYDDEQFRLRVRDDGKGMHPQVLSGQTSQRHYGLPGMRERAKSIGGSVTVWSEIESGTEIELVVPAVNAYATARRGSWFRRNFSAKA